MLALAVVVALSSSLAAAVEDEPAYQAGVAAYRALDYEGAQAQFQAALGSPQLTDGERARVTLWLALIAAGLHDPQAEALFRRAVEIDAAVAMPVKTAPAMTEALEKARADVHANRLARETPAAVDPPSGPSGPSDPSPGHAATSAAERQDPAPSAPPAHTTEAAPPLLPLVVGGAGVASLAGAGVLSIVTSVQASAAGDTSRYADERAASLAAANLALTGALVTGATGALLLAAGAALFVLEP